jgi:hypothetical protein
MISAELSHSDVPTQKTFVDTFEWAQEIAYIGPHAFDRIDMHFSDSVAIIVSSPFVLCVADRGMRTDNVVVAEPLIGVAHPIDLGEPMDMLL